MKNTEKKIKKLKVEGNKYTLRKKSIEIALT